MDRLPRIFRTNLMVPIAVVALLLGCVIALGLRSKPALADVAACSSGAAAQNGISVAPSHGQSFYIDTGTTPVLDAGYIGYRVTNATGSSQSALWTEVSSFTGGVLGLANALDSKQQVTTLANNATSASYFLLKANAATTTPQTHRLKVWNGRPDLPSSSLLYDCLYTFSSVKETIKAAANKVSDTGLGTSAAIEVSNTNPELGQTVVITVEGTSGTIGAGASPDNSIVWLTPAAISSWPTRALRLESVSVTFDRNTNNAQKWTGSGDPVTYTDQLLIPNAQNCLKKNANVSTCSGGTGTTSPEYRAQYTFRVIGIPTSSVKAVPVAQIASGTQIKHADTTGVGSTIDINFSGVSINAALTKSVPTTTGLQTVTCTTTCIVPDGIDGETYVAVPYRLTATSTTATNVVMDEIVDRPQSGVIYKTGSATITDIGRTNAAISDPAYVASEAALSPRPLHFVGPFTFNTTTNAQLNYQMWVPVGSYTNTGHAKVGDLTIGATASAMSKVIVTSNGTSTVGVTVTTEPIGVLVTTDQANNISTTGATLNGTIDPNGTTPLTATFEYSTSPTLSTYTTVTATTPVSGNVGGLNAPTSTAYSLSGLSSNTTYYYRAVAGADKGSIVSFTTNAVLAPPTPITTSATAVTSTTATLNGTINPNLTSVLGIQFIYGTSSTLASGNTTVLLDDGAGSNLTASGASTQPFSTNITGLTNGTTYYYRIRACTTTNCNSGVDGSIVSFVASNPPSNPVLSVVKSEDDTDNTVTPGQTVTYSVTITNSGGVSGTTSLTDTIPTGMGTPSNIVFTNCGSPTSGYSAPTFTISGITITNTASCYITYSVVVSSPLNEGTALTNSVDVAQATEGGNNPAAVSASTLTVDAAPNIATSTKSVSDLNGGAVEPGDALRYSITLINTGDGRATGITVSDTIDSDTENLTNVQTTNCGSPTNSSSTATLSLTTVTTNVGTNCVITFDVAVKSPLSEGTAITNTATVGAPTEGGSGLSPSSTTLTVDATPALSVTKTDNDGDDSVNPSQTVGYTITIQNSGNGQASSISLSDSIDSDASLNTGSFTFTNCGSPNSSSSTSSSIQISSITVAAGATCSISYTVTVNAGASDGATIPNSVDVSAASEGGNNPTSVAASTLTVAIPAMPVPDLSTSTKTVTDVDGGTVEPGDTLSYTVSIINTGSVSASGITLFDTIDSDTINLTNVIVGAESTSCGGSTSNTSSGSILTISNIAINANSTCKVSFEVNVKTQTAEGTTLSNSATISPATEGGSGATPNSSNQTVDTTPVIAITSTDDDADNTVDASQTVTYTLTVANSGNGSGTLTVDDVITGPTSAISNIQLTNCGGSYSNASSGAHLAISDIVVSLGVNCIITYQVTINSNATGGATITNSADATAATEGGNDPNSVSADTLTVRSLLPNLGVTKTEDDSDNIITPGQTIAYTVTIANTGSATGTTSFTDAIPSSFGTPHDVQFTNCGGSATSSFSTPTLTASQLSVAVGTDCIVSYLVDAASPLNEGTTLTNSVDVAQATEGGNDPAPVSATSLSVDATPNLSVTKTDNDADNVVSPGQTITYSVTISNSGNGAATTSLSDTIDSHFTTPTNINFTNCGISATPAFSSPTLSASDVEVTLGVSCVMTYDVAINGGVTEGTTINNSVDVAQAAEGGNNPGLASADTLTVDITPNLSTSTKTENDADNVITPGQTISYTITIINSGTGSATGISLSDTVNTHLALQTGSINIANCGSSYTNNTTSSAISITNLTAAVGTNCVVSINALVASPLNESTVIGNTATISPASEGGSGATPASSNLTVDATPALVATSSDNDADNIVTPNQTVTYTATIQNTGNGDANNVSFSDVLTGPISSLTSVTFTNCGSATNTSTGITASATGITVLAGATCTITYIVTISTSATSAQSVSNVLDVSAASEGGNNPNPASADTLNVNGGNPDAQDDSASVNENAAATAVDWNDNDSLVDGATLSTFDTASTEGGTVTNNGDGTFSYTPAADFFGTDTFTYTVCDNDSPTPSCDTATITVTVEQDADSDGAPDITDGDDDQDGINDAVEGNAPNAGDMNGDGKADNTQSDVSSLPNPENDNEYVSLQTSSQSCKVIDNFGIVTENSLAVQNDQYDFPLGLFNFQIACTNPGDSSSITFYLDKKYDTSNWVYIKYDGGNKDYQNLPQVSFGTAVVNGTTVTTMSYTAADGGDIDEDKISNGFIVDPSGPAILKSESLKATGAPVWKSFLAGITIISVTLFVAKKERRTQTAKH